MFNRFDDEEDETTPTLVVRVIVENKDEEKQQGGARPNAYWQRVREQEAESELEPDTYGGGYRGVTPAPHGGTVTVRPDDLIGSDELCWCGLPAGHDWPGKDKGRKHPRERKAVNTKTATTVDRRDLRAYHARLQDFVMQCVNEDGLRFRLGKNSVILYPPDGTNPATVYARNSDRQVRQLQKWYVAHVYPQKKDEQKDEDRPVDVEQLAKAVNDPVEHPRKQEPEPTPEPEPDDVADEVEEAIKRTRGVEAKNAADLARAKEHPGEWLSYRTYDNEPHEWIEYALINGELIYQCRECVATEHPFYSTDRRGIGGHVRMWHSGSRENLYGRETRAKATESGRLHRSQKTIIEAIETLLPLVPAGTYPSTTEVTELQKKIAQLEGRASGFKRERDEAREALAEAKKEAGNTEELVAAREEHRHTIDALAAAVRRAEDAEAKLAIMREALTL